MSSRYEGGYAGYLTRASARWPTRVGLQFEGQTWTYGALHAAVEAAADRLAAAGVAEGTRVALLVDNCPEYLIAQFALARLGAVFVTPNPYWTPVEIEQALAAAAATAAVYVSRFTDVAARLHIAVPTDSLLDAAPKRPPSTAPSPGMPLYIPFSSGTTGLPKGVVHTVESLCGGVEQLRHHLRLSDDDRLQITLPLCHIFGATMSAAALSVGAEMTLFRRFNLDESLRHITDARVTIWPIAGAVAHRLAHRDDLRAEDFSSLRFFMWGGSAVPVDLAQKITNRTGVGFLCSYGMTEAMMVAFNPVNEPERWRLDSPGYPTEGTQLRITAAGELEVRGPSVAAGYVGTDSNAFLPDGWFATGDLVEIATDGRVRIVDRLKDIFKVSGFQVSPTEVEQVLLAHPDVDEVAVVAQPDQRTGEATVALVVSRAPGLTAEALHHWASTRLASYKRPREYQFVDELPRTAGGKLQRDRLSSQARETPTTQAHK
ncbi:class I adenylate-forming enzyme family protein [Mycobacterium sp.]|uniref:class I adenylate-forming enzyme family protein n=1 Tax=Mycobacterium sp. TaxID=1785 RepID=UPI00122724EC|nr:class I adenylate-forming enzyme family protein [Mycobacterium sp.]TAM65139.1 MAG: long-chain fatty acid--CoA ligase [Mycobacterium sp.]